VREWSIHDKSGKWLLMDLFNKMDYAMLNFDADNKKLAFKFAKKLLKKFGKDFDIYFRRSSSGRGFHFVVCDSKTKIPLYLPKAMVLKIRKQVGDDYGRIAVDKIRIRQDRVISILFDNKNNKNAGKWIKLKTLKQIRNMKVKGK
jgi:hypothetical protein